ncbi:MAG: 2Fe-2S iron-sulfur cluster-binding protein [Candidatus Woesearchaeota archaeon]
MAKLIIEQLGEQELAPHTPLAQPAEALGVAIACSIGLCQSCRVDVLEGAQNLSPLTDEEKMMGMSETTRLLCQCKIKDGTVRCQY